MMLQGLDDWWPCPRCGSVDRDKVTWSDYDTKWQMADLLPDGSEPTFRMHYQCSVSFECAACSGSGREVMVKGATR